MKKNMFKGICTAAVCIALTAFAASNQALASTANAGDKTVSASYFQDSTMQHGNKMNKGMGNKSKMGGKMNSDSTGKMGNMKGKSSGGYKSKGMGKSKMDTTGNK